MVKRLGSERYDTKFCVPRLQGGGGSVGIWGCISHKGIGYAKIYDGRIDQYVYKDTLESCFLHFTDGLKTINFNKMELQLILLNLCKHILKGKR